jgi:hypothetical protein
VIEEGWKFFTGKDVCATGLVFTIIFNSANLILLLNLIIVILSTTYEFFEDKKTGLFNAKNSGKIFRNLSSAQP